MPSSTNAFTAVGGMLTKAPPLFAAIMPIISLILLIVGFGSYKTENSVDQLWVPETTDYSSRMKYKNEILGPSDISSAYSISTPRAGGNVMTATNLLALRDTLNATGRVTVDVGGNTFTFDDICYNPGMPYYLPCFRMHVLDCFAEGAYDFTAIHKATWWSMAKADLIAGGIAAQGATKVAMVKQYMPMGFATLLGMMYSAIVQYALVSEAALGLPCKTSCKNDGMAAVLAQSTGGKAGTWETNASCTACLKVAVPATPKATQDYIYAQGIAPMIAPAGLALGHPKVYDVSRAKKAYNVSKDKAAVDEFVKALAEQYMYKAIVQTAIVSSPSLGQPCIAECPNDGIAAVVAGATGQSAGSWESNETCVECLKIEQPKFTSIQQDATYVQGLASMLVPLGLATGSGPYNVSLAKAHYKASSDKDAVNSFLAQLMHGAVVETGIVSDAAMGLPCKASCTYDGLAGLIAGATGQKAGTWEASTACKSCLATAKAAINTSLQDVAYVQGVAPMMAVSFLAIGPNDYDVSKAKVAFNTSSDKAAVDAFVKALAIDFMYTPVVQTAIVAGTPHCNTSCKPDGIAAIVAGLTGQAIGSWEKNLTCQSCLRTTLNATSTAVKDMMFVQGLAPMMSPYGLATGPTSGVYNLANARANYGVSTDKEAVASFLQGLMYAAVVDTGFVTSTALGLPCKAHCANDGIASVVAAATGQKAGTWGTNASCVACLKTAVAATSSATKDYVYVQGVAPLMGVSFLAVGPGVYDIAPAMAAFGVTSEKAAIDAFLKQFQPMVAAVTAEVEGQVDAGIKAEVIKFMELQTPYTFRTYGAGIGTPRPYLQDPKTGALLNTSDVLAAASDKCYAWDGGLALPANLNPILLGNPEPSDYNATNKLTTVASLEHIWQFMVPKTIQKRVKTRPAHAGGPLNITLEQANQVLDKFKLAYEKKFSEGWDTGAGILFQTAFSDDIGSGGSFKRTLTELTTDSMPLIVVYSIVTVVIAGVILASLNLVESKVLLGMVGALYAILGCFAGLGLSALVGHNLHVVHFWIIPFVVIGIGIDDMFMLACADQTLPESERGGSAAEKFAQAFANVAIPVTMTSLVNCSMFMILAFTSDIKAIYQSGESGLMCTLILYFTMLISFAPLVYLDNRRTEAGRFDGLICLKGSAPTENKPGLSGAFYTNAYKPMTTSLIGRIVMLVLGLILLCLGFAGMTQITTGLDLQDFFPAETWEGKFATERNKFFPVWPVTVNWGQLDYTSAAVQLNMVSQWEKVGACKNVAAAPTKLVWTAAMAQWAQKQTGTCKGTLKPNTLGLHLTTDAVPGVCTSAGCPVLEGLTAAEFRACLLKWKNSGYDYAVAGPSILSDPDGNISWPIKFSQAAGSSLFAVGLFKTADYVQMMKDTRKVVDDTCKSPLTDCYMSGAPFSYWEQYITIIDVIYMLSGLSILLSFIISFAFLFLELTITGRGTVVQRCLGSMMGAFLICLISIMSLCSVVGMCGLAGIQISGFTAMSCLISTALSVEYSVHVVHRFLEGPADASAPDRVDYAMSWLFKPSLMAMITSAVGVLMMAFSEFQFIRMYFFSPLAFAVVISYFYGICMLPSLLCFMPQCLPETYKVADETAAMKDAPVEA